MVFLNLENGTRQSYSHNRKPLWSTKWCHFHWPWTTSNQYSRARHYLALNDWETAHNRRDCFMWPIDLCHCQWPWPTFKVISAISVWNKYSLLPRSLIKSPGDVTKDDIAADLKWPLKVISGTINGFIVCISISDHVTMCDQIKNLITSWQ